MIRRKGKSLVAVILTMMGILFLYGINQKIDKRSYNLGVIGAFSEVVNMKIKRLALSAPLWPQEMEDLLPDALRIAKSNGVNIYLEKDFLTTDLFSEEITKGRYVLLIFLDPVKDQYLALKKQKEILIKTGKYHGEAKRDIARKLGRLLSYPEAKIEEMLAEKKNTP